MQFFLLKGKSGLLQLIQKFAFGPVKIFEKEIHETFTVKSWKAANRSNNWYKSHTLV